jgi:hypothetical protein
VITAIESLLDLEALDAVRKRADDERQALEDSLEELAARAADGP